ncbi:uncharacterized protein LOC144249242 [Urocitellus parryii]
MAGPDGGVPTGPKPGPRKHRFSAGTRGQKRVGALPPAGGAGHHGASRDSAAAGVRAGTAPSAGAGPEAARRAQTRHADRIAAGNSGLALSETSFCPGDICVVILGQHSLTVARFKPVNRKITHHPTPTPVTI